MKQIMRLLREPLFHFVLIGGLLFALYAAVSGPAPVPTNDIVVGPERVAQLAAAYEAVWRRPPNDAEMHAMVDGFVREEVYYREALALGLERDDTIIRRRLQQKMEFLTDTGADLIAPREGELEAYYRANELRFQQAPRIALQQVYLGQSSTPKNISAILTELQSADDADPRNWGERTMLPPRLTLSTPAEVDGVFGSGFFDAIAQLPAETWAGPVESGYGLHLVRVDAKLAARLPPLDEVRDAVLQEWKGEKAKELREQVYARLLARYNVVLPDATDPDNP